MILMIPQMTLMSFMMSLIMSLMMSLKVGLEVRTWTNGLHINWLSIPK